MASRNNIEMGTTNYQSPHSPPTFSARANSSSDTTSSSLSANINLNFGPKSAEEAADGGRVYPTSHGANKTSYSSTEEDDSSKSTVNYSDSETIATNTSKSTNENFDEDLGIVDCRKYLEVPSICSSGSAPSFNSGIVKSKADRIKEANTSDVDKLLLEELQGLSVEDRELVQEEIHGVSTFAVSEDDDKIVEGLKCLEEEIRAIRMEVLASPTHVSKVENAYNESIWAYLAVDEESASASATRRVHSYIFHRDFRLRFLRADLYDAEKAAHRYLRCVECLLKYFGPFALQRPLMYEDLDKECQEATRAGYAQILPSRDRAGRLVVFCQPAINKNSEITITTFLKMITYICQVVSEDTETQKRGAIFIVSIYDDLLGFISNPSSRKEYCIYREGSPVRRSCTHFCLTENDPEMRITYAIMMLAMSPVERIRTRIYMDGLTTETQYKLMTFGILASELPITNTGAIKMKHHLFWIKTRRAIDASRMNSWKACIKEIQREEEENQKQPKAKTSQEVFQIEYCPFPPSYDEYFKYHGNEPIIHPMINDVLFSKGGKNVAHYGNIEFADLMKRSLLKCVPGTPVENRKMRKAIRQSIVDEVQGRGGRFLMLDKKLSGGYFWTEIRVGPDLHDRIATSLYDHKRRLTAKLKLKSMRCGTSMFTGIYNSKRRKRS